MGHIHLENDTYWFLNIWFVIEHLQMLVTKAWFTTLEKWHPMTASRIMWSTKKSPFLRSPFRLKNSQQKPWICREIIAPEPIKTQVHTSPSFLWHLMEFFSQIKTTWNATVARYTFWSSWGHVFHVFVVLFRKSSDFSWNCLKIREKKVFMPK